MAVAISPSSPVDGCEDDLEGGVGGGLLPCHDVRVGEDGEDDDHGEHPVGQHWGWEGEEINFKLRVWFHVNLLIWFQNGLFQL